MKTKDEKVKKENQAPYNIWHPINGKWTHLVKVKDNEFYTDGKLEIINPK